MRWRLGVSTVVATSALLSARPALSQTDPQSPLTDPSLSITVTATRLDDARSSIQPSLGATTYGFSPRTIDNVPLGENAPLNQVLLRAPGVVQDSFGQIHVRGDMGNVQYRLDGVQLPEGLSLFNNVLATRYAARMSLLTGALPAQYGLQTAGIVDITLKSGTTNPGAELSVTGGSRNYAQPAFSYGGRSGKIDYFAAGQYIHNGLGIDNPTASFTPIHDDTDQWYGLAKITGIVDEQTRVSFIGGGASSRFQIPKRSLQGGKLHRVRQQRLEQRILDQRQWEQTYFGRRLAAEELRYDRLPGFRLRPLLETVLPTRRHRRSAVQRHRALDDAEDLRGRRAGRRLLESHQGPHRAWRLPGATRARHHLHQRQHPAAGAERPRRSDERSGPIRPAHRLH